MDARTYAKAAQRLRDKWGDKAGPALEALAEFDAGEYTVEDVLIQTEEANALAAQAAQRRKAIAATMLVDGATFAQVADALNIARGSVARL